MSLHTCSYVKGFGWRVLAGGAWLKGLGGLGWSWTDLARGGLAAGAEGVWPERLLVLVSLGPTKKTSGFKQVSYTSAAVEGWPPSTYLKTVTVDS